MRVTAIKNLPTASWRLLGEGKALVRRVVRPGGCLIRIGSQDETFELQLTEGEARQLVDDLIQRLPPKKAKRA